MDGAARAEFREQKLPRKKQTAATGPSTSTAPPGLPNAPIGALGEEEDDRATLLFSMFACRGSTAEGVRGCHRLAMRLFQSVYAFENVGGRAGEGRFSALHRCREDGVESLMQDTNRIVLEQWRVFDEMMQPSTVHTDRTGPWLSGNGGQDDLNDKRP